MKPKQRAAPKRVQKPAPTSVRELKRKVAAPVKVVEAVAPVEVAEAPVVPVKPVVLRVSSDGVCLTPGVVRSSDGMILKIRGV